MAGYTKLFNSILQSTIWREDDKTRIVWITLLAMADKNGVAETSIPSLADAARVSLEDCLTALEKLKSPDKYSRTKDHEGRRLEECDGGFFMLNHAKYRAKMSADERREYNRQKQAEWREKNVKLPSNKVNDGQSKLSKSTLSAHTEAEAKEDKTPALSGEHQAFIVGWQHNYKVRWSVDYFFKGGRDGKAVKELLALGITRIDLLEIAKKAWDANPPTFETKQAQTIHGFREYINQLNLFAKNANNTKHNPQRIDRSIGTANEGIASRYRGLGKVVKPTDT